MSQTTDKNTRRRERRRRKNRSTNLWVTLLLGGAAVLVGWLLWQSFGNRPIGESFPAYGAGVHVADGNPLEPYRTDPPTSGPHFFSSMPAGFYDEDSPEVFQTPNPQGFLVHSLEHGYIVFWYNCGIVSEEECTAIKAGIQALMESVEGVKIIAWPWSSTDVPVVATSWGYMLEMETWDPDLAAQFYDRNLNHSPEPFAK